MNSDRASRRTWGLRSLRAKLVGFAFLFIGPGMLVGLFFIMTLDKSLDERSNAALLTDASRLRDQVGQWLEMNTRSVHVLGTDPILHNPDATIIRARLERLVAIFPSWQAAGVIEGQRLVFAGPHADKLRRLCQHPLLARAIKTGRPVVLSVETLGESAPGAVLSEPNAPCVTMLTWIDPASSRALNRGHPMLPPGGATALLSKAGMVLETTLDTPRAFDHEAFRQAVYRSGSHIDLITWPDGVRRLTAGALIPQTGWVLLVGWTEETAYGTIWRLASLLMGVLMVLVVVDTVGALWLSRLWTEPLRALTVATEEFRKGNLASRAPVFDDDEISQLARSFNHMAERIAQTQHAMRDTLQHQQESLSATRLRMKLLDRARANFSANISHELRTPLSVILAQASALEEELFGPLSETQRGALRALMHAGGQLITQIDELIDLADLSRGELSVHPYPVEACPLIGGVIESFRPTCEAQELTLAFDCADDLPPMHTDPYRMEQILRQLLSNAVKFTERGGTITVCVRATEDGLLTSVHDTGTGIPPEAIETLFTDFMQADPTSTRRHGGMGIGLYLVKELTERLGGKVSVQSHPGGTTVTVAMPVASA